MNDYLQSVIPHLHLFLKALLFLLVLVLQLHTVPACQILLPLHLPARLQEVQVNLSLLPLLLLHPHQ